MNLRKYKLLITDVDGTALDATHQLHPETVQAFQRLRDFGVRTMFATGKISPSVEYLASSLCGDSPFLVGHASIAQDQEGHILLRHGLSIETMEIISQVSEKHNCDYAVYLASGILAREFNHNMKYLTEYWEPEAEEVPNWPDLGERVKEVVKVTFVNCDSDEVLERVADDLFLELGETNAIQFSVPHMVEVTNLKAKKEYGLEFVSDYFGITPAEMIAVGDGLNDVGMVQYAGYGVAMGNGKPELKEVADEVIGSNSDNGLAKAINRWIDESV